ncbi:MAG: class I SAM-dependent methyltransferase, partial [Pseudomonadota bacterium]
HDSYHRLATYPWRAPRWDPSPEAGAVPTMLTREEGRLLTWLGAVWARGAGAVVDLGAFAGGSTARLADGLVRGGRAGEVAAFDLFTVSEAHKAAFLSPFPGTDLMPEARRLLEPWPVTLHRADLAETGWTGGPIEILFIDAMKTPSTADAIAANFYPSLIPGRSVIVHQDYQHWRQPWIAAQMARLPGLRPVAWCRENSVVFAVDRVPGPRDLAAARVGKMGDAEMTALLREALALAPHERARRMLALSILGLEDRPGCRRPAEFSRERISPARIANLLAQAADKTPPPHRERGRLAS